MNRRFQDRGPPKPSRPVAETLKYTPEQEHLLRRIAGAIVLHWDALSDDVQDLIIDQAVLVDDRDEAAHEAADIERFIRTVKTAAIAKPAVQ